MENEFEIWVLSASADLVSRDLVGAQVVTDAGSNAAFFAEGALSVSLPVSEIAAALGTGAIDAAAFTSVEQLLPLARADSSLSLYRFTGNDNGLADRFLVDALGNFGTEGADLMTSFAIDPANQNEQFFGLGGDDRIGSFAGDDQIYGGAGTDTAVMSASQSSVTVTLFENFTLMEDRTGAEGADSLYDIEMLEFGGSQTLDLGRFGGLTGLEGPELAQFIELYIAYFNRAPDAVGLGFWGTAFAKGEATLEQSATLFIDQPETRAAYPEGTTNDAFVTTVYQNVLGRQSDQAGFDFWVGVLNDGSVTRDQFILELLRGAKAEPPAGADQSFIDQQLADRAFLSNKTDLGTYFAVTLGMSNVANASAAMALYDGTQDGFDAAVAAIDGYYQAALDPNSGEFLFKLAGVLDNPIPVTFEINGETITVDAGGSFQFDGFDNDTGTGLMLTAVSNPGNGTVDFPGPSSALFTYTPNADFVGQDSFTYTVRDEAGREATATVNITVESDLPAFVVTDDAITVDEDSTIQFDVFDNDVGTGLSLTEVSDPGNGRIEFTGATAGGLTYTPNANFSGEDSFTYTVRAEDGREETATVNITVEDVDDIGQTIETAQMLGLSVDAFTSEIETPFDFDLFKVTEFPTSDDSILIKLTNGFPSAGAEFFIFTDLDDTAVASSGSDGQLVFKPANQQDDLYIRVAQDPSVEGAADQGQYFLLVDTTDTTDEIPDTDLTQVHVDFDENNTWSLFSDTNVGGEIEDAADKDWIGVMMSGDNDYLLQLSSLFGTDGVGSASMRIFDDNGVEVFEFLQAVGASPTFSPEDNTFQQYFIEIDYDEDVAVNTVGFYDLQVTEIA